MAGPTKVFAEGLVVAVRSFVERKVDPVASELAALTARVAALEARPALSYEGVFEGGKIYGEGSLVTRAGSLWIATTTTSKTPGDGGDSGWKLAVKRGRGT